MQISASSDEPVSEHAMDALWTIWKRMAAMFPGKWTKDNGAAPVKADGALTVAGDTWLQVIRGLKPSQLAKGLASCLTEGREWPPNGPRFLAMCHGLPSLSRVEQEMAPSRGRSGFAVLVRSMLDLHVFNTADGVQQGRMVRDAYERALQHVLNGNPLPSAAPALPQPAPKPPKVRDRSAAATAMARAAAELGFEP